MIFVTHLLAYCIIYSITAYIFANLQFGDEMILNELINFKNKLLTFITCILLIDAKQASKKREFIAIIRAHLFIYLDWNYKLLLFNYWHHKSNTECKFCSFRDLSAYVLIEEEMFIYHLLKNTFLWNESLQTF